MSLDEKVYAKLRSIFGFDTFRPNQESLVEAILAGRDVFGIMPTGGGKSLCYQLPACLMGGTTVVVSPLISLMKDQVDAAGTNGISSGFLNSSQTESGRRSTVAQLFAGTLDLLYVSPERIALDGFFEMLGRAQVNCFAIDEAHCVSEWGHDFRPDYLCLSKLVHAFPSVPLAAFTATATSRVQNDIVARLGLRNPHIVRASFDRPNLLYRVQARENANTQILRFVQRRPSDTGIVYRMTRKAVESTTDFLIAHGIEALPYHAGLSDKARQSNQDAFNRDETKVIVATIAFGMGIDKSNVRFVIHGDLPKNMESYYQETGRGGRDSEPADCMLLYGPGDIVKVRHFIDEVTDEREHKRLMDGLYAVVNYAQSNVCRRHAILGYFGEQYGKESCGMCDVCLGEVETSDATMEAQMILSAAVRSGERFGLGHLVDIVTGADTGRIRRLGHDKLPTYGVGKDHPKAFWHSLAGELVARQIMVLTDDQFPVARLLPKAKEILRGNGRFAIVKRKEIERAAKRRARRGPDSGSSGDLFDYLRAIRMQLARAIGVPPYVVFNDKTLREMADFRPRSQHQMLLISGVGERKLARFGTAFLNAIERYEKEWPVFG